MLIRDVRPWGGAPSDVTIADGRIRDVRPHEPESAPGKDDVQGHGRLLLPAFSDVHVHLDSTRIGLPFRPHTGAPGVWQMMLNDRRNWRDAEIPLPDRATTTLERMIVHGTTRVRTFAQVDVDCRLEKLDAVLTAKEALGAAADVQVMIFPQAGLLREAGTVEVVEEAVRRGGVHAVGGIDPCQLDRDPARHLDIVFGLAEKYDVDVDVHLHEPGELGIFSAELIAERTRALGMQGRVNISHAYDLGAVSESASRSLIDLFAELDISMTTVAPAAAGQLSLVDLTAHGVRVGLGEDGQRDYWSPYGNGDMLDRTWQLAFTRGFRRDELIEHCTAVATVGGAGIMDRSIARLASVTDRPGVDVGDRADFVIVAGETVTSAVMDRSTDRTVIHDGRVVADGGVRC